MRPVLYMGHLLGASHFCLYYPNVVNTHVVFLERMSIKKRAVILVIPLL